jgi:HrpA-like RNA helicase
MLSKPVKVNKKVSFTPINLPITSFKGKIQAIMSTSDSLIIGAETGAGKSTQVPQYLAELGYKVIVCQPRVLAAISLAERVAQEMGVRLGQEVGYQTGDDSKISNHTQVLFSTYGCALNMLKGFHDNTILVLDEIHEWSVEMEVLLHLGKEHFPKVVVMSATMCADELSTYMGGAPTLEVPGRVFPVEIIPSIGTPRHNIMSMVKQGLNTLVFLPGKAEINALQTELSIHLQSEKVEAIILPLHGELTSQEQSLVFKHYGVPKVILSTNVAQTSVTIDDIHAVVDTGMERRVELIDGIEGLYLRPISLASAKQRKGRAGRVQEGLYVDMCSVDTNNRLEYDIPEIHRVRLENVILRLAQLGYDIESLNLFHMPSISSIQIAKAELSLLGCLVNGKVTLLGSKVVKLPLGPQAGVAFTKAVEFGLGREAAYMAALMECGSITTHKNKAWMTAVFQSDSDLLAQMEIIHKLCAGYLNRGEAHNLGLMPKAYERLMMVSRKLYEFLPNRSNTCPVDGKKKLLLAMTYGLKGSIWSSQYRRLLPFSEEGINTKVTGREIGKESVLVQMRTNSEFYLGKAKDLQVETRKGSTITLRLVTDVTAISKEIVEEVLTTP